MNEDKSNTKDNKLEFNTYCIFTEEKQNIGETIGLVFILKSTLYYLHR